MPEYLGVVLACCSTNMHPLTSSNAGKRHLWRAHAKAAHGRHSNDKDGEDRDNGALHLDTVVVYDGPLM